MSGRRGEEDCIRPADKAGAVSASSGRTKFLGTHIPDDVHRRLYRIKAAMEYQSGGFYGLGRVLQRAIEIGIDSIEEELNLKEG